jgi:hypothetical protein
MRMRSRAKNLAFVLAVVCFVVLWRATTDPDIAIAQERKSVALR